MDEEKRRRADKLCVLQKAGIWKDHGRIFVHLGVSYMHEKQMLERMKKGKFILTAVFNILPWLEHCLSDISSHAMSICLGPLRSSLLELVVTPQEAFVIK